MLEKIEVIQSSLLKLSSEPKTETNTEKLVKTSPPPVVPAAGSGISDTGKRSAQDKTSKPHEFLKNIEGLANELELRYARDMMFAITRRRKNFHGNLCERKSSGTGLKEKLCLDIYTLYAFNEGSISALPKNMLKSEAKQTTTPERPG